MLKSPRTVIVFFSYIYNTIPIGFENRTCYIHYVSLRVRITTQHLVGYVVSLIHPMNNVTGYIT